MLGEAIGSFLPSAIAVALSPIPIVAIVLVLGAPRARTAGPAFALGWIVGLAAATALLVIALGGADDPNSDTATGVNWVKVAIGIVFLVMAAKQWTKRPKGDQPPEVPGWMATVDGMAAPKAGVLGVALSAANPKNLALAATGAASIAQAGLTSGDTVIAVVVFVVLASVTVAGSVLFYVVDPEQAVGPLNAVKEFMSDNNAVIMMVVLLLLGAKILGDGLSVLWR